MCDDDDFYPSHHVATMIAPILDGRADVTAPTLEHLYHAPTNRWWKAKDRHVNPGPCAFRR